MGQQAPPQYSPDRRWWWDGTKWVPVRPASTARPGSPMLWVWIAGAVASLLVLGVCGIALANFATTPTSSGSSGPPRDITGTYSLERPVTTSTRERLVITGSFILRADSTWTIELNWRGSFVGARYSSDEGRYTRSGATLMFQPSWMDPFSGQLSGNSLTARFDFDGDGTLDTFLFSR